MAHIPNQQLLVKFLADHFGVNANDAFLDFILKPKLQQKAQIETWLDKEIALRQAQKANLDVEKTQKSTRLDSEIIKLTNLKSGL